MWRRAGDKFGTRHSLNEERKTEETRPDYGGQDGRLWRSVEMRARDSQPWKRTRLDYGGQDGRLWRSVESSVMEEKRGKNGKRGAERGREQVENEEREGTNGKMG